MNFLPDCSLGYMLFRVCVDVVSAAGVCVCVCACVVRARVRMCLFEYVCNVCVMCVCIFEYVCVMYVCVRACVHAYI